MPGMVLSNPVTFATASLPALATAAALVTAGDTLTVTSGFKVGANQVVGARAAAEANLSLGALTLLTDAITAIGTIETKVNATLAKLRTHGLIAP